MENKIVINPDWDFDSGDMALDFANTLEWRGSSRPVEQIADYIDFVTWSARSKILSTSEADRMRTEAAAHPREAAAAHRDARDMREVFFRIFSATARGEEPSPTDIEKLNAGLQIALARSQVIPTETGFEWGWMTSETDLRRLLWPLVRSAAELMTSNKIARVGKCSDDRGCNYLFIDSSRNRSRRWCSMETCGNRAKARRYYQRQKVDA